MRCTGLLLEGGRRPALSMLCRVSAWSLCLSCGAHGRDGGEEPRHQPYSELRELPSVPADDDDLVGGAGTEWGLSALLEEPPPVLVEKGWSDAWVTGRARSTLPFSS